MHVDAPSSICKKGSMNSLEIRISPLKSVFRIFWEMQHAHGAGLAATSTWPPLWRGYATVKPGISLKYYKPTTPGTIQFTSFKRLSGLTIM